MLAIFRIGGCNPPLIPPRRGILEDDTQLFPFLGEDIGVGKSVKTR